MISSFLRLIFSRPRFLAILLFPLAFFQEAWPEPLRVHPSNRRYFTDGGGKAIYLTGSHTWDNFHGMPPRSFDFPGYLDFLQKYHHNFIRLWSGKELIHEIPSIYERVGPGKALDGGLRVDLKRLNRGYFERLRARVEAAQKRGIFVSVKLFHGDNVLNEGDNKNWPHHPFHLKNNTNGINGDPDGDGVGLESHTLQIPEIVSLQSVYVRKVIDTLNDLDNVLYEISNEEVGSPRNPGNAAWQYHWIQYVKHYEATHKRKRHPVIMTAQWPAENANEVLFGSPADAISPSGDPYRHNPPPSDATKIILADVDHIWPVAPQGPWVWKCFMRGIQPILMDWYHRRNPTWISTAEQEVMRRNMGHTLKYAKRMDLASMTPRDDLVSSGYCLASAGREYLIYLPDRRRHSLPVVGHWLRNSVMVNLGDASAVFRVEWFNPSKGERLEAESVRGRLKSSFRAPFAGEAVLYLSAR